MGKNSKRPISQPREQIARQRLANLETTQTEASSDADSGTTSGNFRLSGEKVPTPTSALMGNHTDWGKIGVYVAIGIFCVPVIFSVAWFFSDLNSSVRGVVDEVKDLKRKTDDLFRQTTDSMARISALERPASTADKQRSDKKN